MELIPGATGDLDHQAAEGQQADQVGQYHQAVEHIGQTPDQIHFQGGTYHDKDHHDHGVQFGGPLAEQGLHIDLAEEIPADDGGEGEEQHTDGHKGVAEGAKGGVEGGLGQGGTLEGAVHRLEHTGGDDDQGSQGEHHKGVDKHAHHGNNALILGLFHLGHGVGVRGGAHTGFVGEQAPGHAVPHGLPHTQAQSAAKHRLGIKGAHKDGAHGGEQGLVVDAQDDDAAYNVEQSHDGDDLLREGGNTPHTAQEDKGGNDSHHHAHRQFGNAKGGVEGVADGVGLDHIAHKAKGQDDGDGKEAGQELAELAPEGCPDVVQGAAGDMAVGIGGAEPLSQHRLGIDGGHAEEGGQPHPEDGAGAAGIQGGGAAGDVAGAHLGGNGGGQGLEGGHTLLACPGALHGEAAEQPAHSFAEFTQLDKTQTYRKENTGGYQQKEQRIVPQHGVDRAHQSFDPFHCTLSSSLGIAAKKRAKPHTHCGLALKYKQKDIR